MTPEAAYAAMGDGLAFAALVFFRIAAVVSVILGEGCGGGALALLPAARVIATENAWLSPLPPEGASVIVHGDIAHAPEMAERQRVRAADLLADGVVHEVVPEVEGETAQELAVAVAAEVGAQLRTLVGPAG